MIADLIEGMMVIGRSAVVALWILIVIDFRKMRIKREEDNFES